MFSITVECLVLHAWTVECLVQICLTVECLVQICFNCRMFSTDML